MATLLTAATMSTIPLNYKNTLKWLLCIHLRGGKGLHFNQEFWPYYLLGCAAASVTHHEGVCWSALS